MCTRGLIVLMRTKEGEPLSAGVLSLTNAEKERAAFSVYQLREWPLFHGRAVVSMINTKSLETSLKCINYVCVYYV